MDTLEKLVKAQERIQALEQQNEALEREYHLLRALSREALIGEENVAHPRTEDKIRLLNKRSQDVQKLVDAARAILAEIKNRERQLPNPQRMMRVLAEALKPFEQEKR